MPCPEDSPPAAPRSRGLVIPPPPPLSLTPARARALVTVSVGEEGRALLAASRGHMERYAQRVGADLVVLDWPGHPQWPMSAKFGISRVLDHYERIAYVDADILLRPGCVDLFDLCAPDEYGAVDELPWHRAQPRFGREKAYQRFRREMGFRDVKHLPWMLNAGVQVVPRAYRHLLLPPEKPIRPGHCAEQDLVNARVLDGFLEGRVKVRLLDRRGNWQNWQDHGFRAAPPDAVLHWSGAGGARPSRAEQIREWAAREPWPAPCYVIASTPRSGSSLLAEALLDCGFGYAAEWFPVGADTGACLAAMRKEGTRGGVTGVKVHGDQLRRHGLADLLPREFPGTRYVLLSRRDRVRQAVSLARAIQTGAWTSRDAPRGAPAYDREQIARCLADIEGQHQAWEDFLASRGITPLRVDYEDLVGDREGTVRRVLAFLGAPAPARIPPPRLARQADAISEEWARAYAAGGG